jgi:hypothetical protein
MELGDRAAAHVGEGASFSKEVKTLDKFFRGGRDGVNASSAHYFAGNLG